MLKVTLTGNLGADPEVRYTQNGDESVSFRVAVNQKRRARDGGDDEEITTWFRVRCFGIWCERAKDLSKGSRVYVDGRLDVGSYTAQDGEKRTSLDVRCDNLEAFSRPERSTSEGGDEPRQERPRTSRQPAAAGARSQAAAPADDSDLEDLPF